MSKLIITTETKDEIKRYLLVDDSNVMFVTEDDIVFDGSTESYISVKSPNEKCHDTTHGVYFCNKHLYPKREGILPFYLRMDHFYLYLPLNVHPIYSYGIVRECNSDTINVMIRDYSKFGEEQKMFHFHVTDLTLSYQ